MSLQFDQMSFIFLPYWYVLSFCYFEDGIGEDNKQAFQRSCQNNTIQSEVCTFFLGLDSFQSNGMNPSNQTACCEGHPILQRLISSIYIYACIYR